MLYKVQMGRGGRKNRMYLADAHGVVIKGFDGGINAIMNYLRAKHRGKTVVGGRFYGTGESRTKEIHVI